MNETFKELLLKLAVRTFGLMRVSGFRGVWGPRVVDSCGFRKLRNHTAMTVARAHDCAMGNQDQQ